MPVSSLAEEISTPGEGQVRGLLTLAGNPVLSTPDGQTLDRALGGLEAMVSHDFYLNETTRHAHVILPASSPMERPHYPLGIYPNALRNLANWSPPVLPPRPDRPADWQIVLRLAAIVGGRGPDVDVDSMDDDVARGAVERRVGEPGSALAGLDPDAVLAELAPRVGPERMIDLMLRSGPYGDHFGRRPDGLTLAGLEAAPHGIDFGPLEPRLPGILRTPSGKVELAPPTLLAEGDRLESALATMSERSTMLIGRREPRTLNSWLHNLPNLAGGRNRCTLMMHPDDAAAASLCEGDLALIRSRTGEIELPVQVSDELMPGVVSVPHGWGHETGGTRQDVANGMQGVNVNRLIDRQEVDVPSGTSVLSGVPVTVIPAVGALADQPLA
jgi:anaerobic selenocysteine-containing dehydrogenase